MSRRISITLSWGLAGAFALIVVSPLSAAVFTENFEAMTIDTTFTTPWTVTQSTNPLDDPKSTVTVREDSAGALFGTIGNKYGEFIDPRTTSPSARATATYAAIQNSILIASFDFYEPNDGVGVGLASNNEPHTLNIQIGTAPAGQGTRAIDFRLGEGAMYYRDASMVQTSAGTYTLGAKHHLEIVANFNAASSTYAGGTVANGAYDVWLNGVLALNDVPFRVDAQKELAITGILFGADNVTTQNAYIDNISISVPSTAQAGDYDSDGDVDGADFVAWQTNFPKASGATLAEGDADADGDVDGADFVVWQTNFPFTPGPGAAPVPEPATMMMGLAGFAGLLLLRRARR
jgi:hypothetical protein